MMPRNSSVLQLDQQLYFMAVSGGVTYFAHIAAMQYAYERSLVVVPRDAARMAEHSVALDEQVSKS